MIIIVSTPIRLIATYALTFAAGAALAWKWQSGQKSFPR